MKIITAFADSNKNDEIKKYFTIDENVIFEDIYYAEGILDMLNVYPDIEILFVSEDIIGSEKLYEIIKNVGIKYKKIKILLISNNNILIKKLKFFEQIKLFESYNELILFLENTEKKDILKLNKYNTKEKAIYDKKKLEKGGMTTDTQNFNIENIEELKERLLIFKKTGNVISKKAYDINKLNENTNKNKISKNIKNKAKIVKIAKIVKKEIKKIIDKYVISSLLKIKKLNDSLKQKTFVILKLNILKIIYLICEYEIFKESTKEMIKIKVKEEDKEKYNKYNEN